MVMLMGPKTSTKPTNPFITFRSSSDAMSEVSKGPINAAEASTQKASSAEQGRSPGRERRPEGATVQSYHQESDFGFSMFQWIRVAR